MTVPMTLTEADVRHALTSFGTRTRHRPDLKAAAVAVTLVTGATGALSVLITRRASELRSHSGQYALPGGRVEPGESVAEAARRELAEELGLDLAPEAVLGRLDDYPTRSGYLMSAVVLWAGRAGPLLRPRPAEVSAVYGIGIEELDVEPRFLSIPESPAPVIQLPLLGGYLHAPTAAVLYQFREVVLCGRPTRVGHLEQPVFAWR